MTLAWSDPSNSDITGYQFQQKAGTGSYGPWTPISSSGPATVSHAVRDLTNGTVYGFRIRAVAGTVHGAVSDERTATPQAPVPVVQFGSATYTGSEAAGSRTVTVELSASPAFSAPTSISYVEVSF